MCKYKHAPATELIHRWVRVYLDADYAYTHVLIHIHTSAQILENIEIRAGCNRKLNHCQSILAEVAKHLLSAGAMVCADWHKQPDFLCVQ